jgi:exopolysaccharide production protein ExoQ
MRSRFVGEERVRPSVMYFVFFYFFIANGSLATLLSGGDERGGVAFSIAWAFAYGLTILFFVSHRNGFVFYRREGFLYVLLALVVASFTWSVMPKSTFFYSMSIVFNLIFAMYCSRVLSIEAFFRILLKSLNFTIAVGLLLALLRVDLAFYIDPLARSNILGVSLIKGLFSHKIYAGFYSAMALYLNWLFLQGRSRYFYSFIALIGVLVSGSSLGLVALGLGGVFLTVLRIFSGATTRDSFLLPAITVSLFVFLIGMTFYVEILGLLGRDASLTGRTDLWGWALKFWTESPIVGWGYAGIFGDLPEAPSNLINDDSYYQAPHFHSGYLQVLAELGIIGFSLFVGMLFWSVKASIRYYWRFGSVQYLAVSVLVGFAMNIFMRYNELSSLIVIFSYLALKAKPGCSQISRR